MPASLTRASPADPTGPVRQKTSLQDETAGVRQDQDKPTVGRLKSRPQFLAVRNGERRKGALFSLEVLDRRERAPQGETEPRVGFTVTKKHGNAVERNRMRRRLREAVRLVAGDAMKPGYDYVIVARREVLTAPFDTLVKRLCERIEQKPGRGPRTAGSGKE